MIRLVIVDDMPDIRNYLAEELAAASEQFSVVGAAEDGTEAVKLVDSLLPDVVLMDIQMKTRTEGIYAIRIIHERHPDIKCIALTIHEDDELIFQAYLAGAADYIIKTRSIDTIKNSILAVVNNRLLLRPEVGQRLIQEYQRVQNQENRMKETMQVMLKINTTEYEILRMACAGMSMAELALAYNLSTPGVTCVIPGGKTPEQVRKNVQAAGLRIPEEMRQRLADVPGFVY